MAEDSNVFYCYRCGKRVKRAAGNCWYCGAENRRDIRPPRHCPFCGEHISHKAIKCPHCSEFLDGRERVSAPAGPPQHVTFIIDKAVIQGDQPLMLEGGKPLPANLSNLLSNRTARAIESNNPALIDQAGVKALPLYEPTRTDSPVEKKTGGALVPVQPAVPALRKTGAALTKSAGSALSRLTDRIFSALEKSPSLETPTRETVLDAEEATLYKTCTVCGTETLASDNYCFHCGAAQRKISVSRKKPKFLGDFPFAILFLCALFLGGMAYFIFAGSLFDSVPIGAWTLRDVLKAAFSLLCLIFLGTAFFKRRTTASQMVVIVFLILWALMTLIALLTAKF